jgi:transcriptional regulator with XRE-family HTH domain
METLGTFIRRTRDEKDISLREFARRLGISAAFASDIELGRRFPSEDMLEKVAEVLDSELTTLRKLDTRAPVDDLKRLSDTDPTFGIAFRTLVERKVDPEELLAWVQGHRKHRKS